MQQINEYEYGPENKIKIKYENNTYILHTGVIGSSFEQTRRL